VRAAKVTRTTDTSIKCALAGNVVQPREQSLRALLFSQPARRWTFDRDLRGILQFSTMMVGGFASKCTNARSRQWTRLRQSKHRKLMWFFHWTLRCASDALRAARQRKIGREQRRNPLAGEGKKEDKPQRKMRSKHTTR